MNSSGNFHVVGSRVATEISAQEPVMSKVKDSPKSLPEMVSRTTARSYTVFAIGPAESKCLDIGTIPSCGTKPIVGLIVYKAALPAGHIKDPSVSAPMDTGAYPADTPTAEPEEDPEGPYMSHVVRLRWNSSIPVRV